MVMKEEDSVEIRDVGRFLWNIYQGCLDAGFDKTQSFQIVLQWVSGLSSGNHSSTTGPPSDLPNED